MRLLNRTTRKLHLTEVGEEFYQSCRLILDEAQEAVRRAPGPAGRDDRHPGT
ncbi:MAG: hypothetical protein R3F43_13810 [bacterium]